MKVMTINEQMASVAGWTCPMCGYSTGNVLSYSVHGWIHLLTYEW